MPTFSIAEPFVTISDLTRACSGNDVTGNIIGDVSPPRTCRRAAVGIGTAQSAARRIHL